MPDKDSIAVLKFIAAHTKVKIDISNPLTELSRIKDLENTIFYLLTEKYISEVNPCPFQTGNEHCSSVSEYKIEPLGKKALQEYSCYCISEIRNWITAAIAVVAFALSVISLYLQYKSDL